jgi:hypothetical protein
MSKMKFYSPHWEMPAGPASRSRQADHERLADVIALTAEACGHPLSAPAARMFADDLSHIDDAAIRAALARCRRELDGPLRIVEVLSRIDDGRPDADEAWSMMPADEHESVVWTEEMAHAWGIAQPFLDAGEVAVAQVAFRKAYEKSVLEARIARKAPRWIPSLGLDVDGREMALRDAVTKGRATAAQAEQLLGHSLGKTGEEAEFAQRDNMSLH